MSTVLEHTDTVQCSGRVHGVLSTLHFCETLWFSICKIFSIFRIMLSHQQLSEQTGESPKVSIYSHFNPLPHLHFHFQSRLLLSSIRGGPVIWKPSHIVPKVFTHVYGCSRRCGGPVGAVIEWEVHFNPLINGTIQHTFKINLLFVEIF